MVATHLQVEDQDSHRVLRLTSDDGTNRLSARCVLALTGAVLAMRSTAKPLVITGGAKFFSAGADLAEIQLLNAHSALAFAGIGQRLMSAIAQSPFPTYAAVHGYCMGGGLDLALACHRRIASPHARFGHRGAAFGLMTGWGGTQRLSDIVGKGRALAMFVSAAELHARDALSIGLVDAIADDPIVEAIRQIHDRMPAGSLLP